MSTAPYVVLLNNDTEAVPGWLDKLRAGFTGPRVGIVGPLMKVDKPADDPIFKVSKPCWQSAWKVRYGGGPYRLPRSAMVAFFCAMFDRRVFDRIGALDEGFGVGFGDDDDFCERAHRAGYEIVLQQDLAVPHKHRSTFQELYEAEDIAAMQAAAMRTFRAKCRASR